MMNPTNAFRLLVIVVWSLMVSLSYAAGPMANYEQGVQLGAQGKFAEAKAAFERGLQVDAQSTQSRNALTYSHRGDAYADKGQLDKALADYNLALEINPRYATAYLNRGILYAKQ